MSLEQFITLADSIVEFESDYCDHRYPNNSIRAIEVHRNELENTWGKVKAAFEKFLFDKDKKRGAETVESAGIENLKVKYKSTYITYCNCLTKLAEDSEALREKPGTANDPSSFASPLIDKNTNSNSPGDSHRFHLPPCELEVFRGDYRSWPTFRDLFVAMYIKNSVLSPVEKLFHLNQKTAGEAKEIVKKSPLTNEGFDIAWANLCERFENRRILVNNELKILFNLQSITSESGKAIQQLQRTINSCISNLQLHKINIESWDPIFVFLCANRLPDSTLTLWEDGLQDKSSIPKWSDLDLFLTNRHRTLESVFETRSFNPSKISEPKSRASNQVKKVSTFQNNVVVPKCPLCPKEVHIIRKCPKFLEMNHKQRFQEIKSLGLCINCFSKSHSVRTCKSKNNCFRCNQRHHTLLHKDLKISSAQIGAPSSYPNSNLNPNSKPFNNVATFENIQSTSGSDASRINSCFASQSKGILLGTTMVQICYLGTTYQVRALIDSGSEGSFISEKLFNLLKLPYKRKSAQISGLNNALSATVSKECSFVIRSLSNENAQVAITALVVPHLSNNLPSRTYDHSFFSNLPDIPLADPNFHTSSKIDILIGGDVFPSIMLSGLIKNVCNSLIAQETIFGWILTGPLSQTSTSKSVIVSNFCEVSLDREISRFWEVENLPRKNNLSISDQFRII